MRLIFDNIEQHLSMWFRMLDRYDYNGYCASCSRVQLEPYAIDQFAVMAGIGMLAVMRHFDKPLLDAYKAVVAGDSGRIRTPADIQDLSYSAEVSQPICTPCGGGKVR